MERPATISLDRALIIAKQANNWEYCPGIVGSFCSYEARSPERVIMITHLQVPRGYSSYEGAFSIKNQLRNGLLDILPIFGQKDAIRFEITELPSRIDAVTFSSDPEALSFYKAVQITDNAKQTLDYHKHPVLLK